MKQHGVHKGKYLLKASWNAIFETLDFKISLDALALKLPTITYQPAT